MNESGIYPVGDRLLVKPDEIEKKTAGGILLPETDRERHELGQLTGVVIAMGVDCYTHTVKTVERLIDGQMKEVERVTSGYSKPWCKVGDRVAFARYAGHPANGKDGIRYRLMNDEDITAAVDEAIDFTEFRGREAVS